MAVTDEIVWLTEERTYARLIEVHAYHSVVEFTRGGIDYRIIVVNDEYVYREDHAIEHESE